jgi:CubicO group peptidase (beta-lactamase class C family)
VPWPTDTWPRTDFDARVDRASIEDALTYAFSQPDALGQTNAALLIQGGQIVAEQYAEGNDATTTHPSWSMAKSILHAAVGVLVGQGRLVVDAPTGHPAWAEPDDSRRAITLGQLLQMRSGLLFREDYVDDKVSHVIEMLFGSGKDDTAGFASALPLAHPPDTVFNYSSGTSNIVSSIAARALAGGPCGELEDGEESYRAFLRDQIFDPIGMRSAQPRFDGVGHWIGSSFMFATAQDFARFGLLYLRDGIWDGRRVLPSGWVDFARTLSGQDDAGGFYGAHWWLTPGSLGIFRAAGYQGQRIIAVPALDLLVVRLGVTPVEKAPELERWTKQLIDAFRPSRAVAS